jgi:hypothetical protein
MLQAMADDVEAQDVWRALQEVRQNLETLIREREELDDDPDMGVAH